MTPDQIQNKLNEAVMNIQSLQAELDKLKSNLSEIPNSCDHYIPQPGEVVEVSWNGGEWHNRIFLEYQKEDESPYCCVTNSHFNNIIRKYRNGEKYTMINFSFCRRLSGEIIEFGCDKPTQYHVAVHEAVTAEPNPYAVDWSNAPEWADVHCFDKNGKGAFYGAKRDAVEWYHCNQGSSGFTLPTGLDWTKSKTTRPCK